MNAHYDDNGAIFQSADPEKEEALAFWREQYTRFAVGLLIAAICSVAVYACHGQAVAA